MIHTSSIQTIFDKNYLDQLHFGGSLKTYVIPCKYNQADPYKSVNGEYFILFCVPPKKYLKFFHNNPSNPTDLNDNFTPFMQRFIPNYI